MIRFFYTPLSFHNTSPQNEEKPNDDVLQDEPEREILPEPKDDKGAAEAEAAPEAKTEVETEAAEPEAGDDEGKEPKVKRAICSCSFLLHAAAVVVLAAILPLPVPMFHSFPSTTRARRFLHMGIFSLHGDLLLTLPSFSAYCSPLFFFQDYFSIHYFFLLFETK